MTTKIKITAYDLLHKMGGGFSRFSRRFRLATEVPSDSMWAEVGFVTFGRQVLATLLVLCGMTVLDIGSRAHAAFLTNVIAPQSGTSTGSASKNDHESLPSWPISEDSQYRFTKFLVAYTNFGNSGAGVPPTTSSTSGSSSVPALGSLNLLPDFDHISNERVRMLVHRTGLSSLLVSIFEPPRAIFFTH